MKSFALASQSLLLYCQDRLHLFLYLLFVGNQKVGSGKDPLVSLVHSLSPATGIGSRA